MSIQKGISRIGSYIAIILGIILAGFIFLINYDSSLWKSILYGIVGFVIVWIIIKLLTKGIVWIVEGFKEK